VRIDQKYAKGKRDEIFRALRAEGIGVNVHYIPVHLHPYYRTRFGERAGLCPIAEKVYTELISLPMFHGMLDQDVNDVIEAVDKVLSHFVAGAC
jgi:perosamine synthetase